MERNNFLKDMMMRELVVWRSMKNEFGEGSWAVTEGMLTVCMAGGIKKAELRGMDPENLARLLMWEIASEVALA